MGAKEHEKELPRPADRDALPLSFAADVKEDIDAHLLDSFEIIDIREPIDFDGLGKRVARVTSATALFGDVSGFTAYVAGLADDDAKKLALRRRVPGALARKRSRRAARG